MRVDVLTCVYVFLAHNLRMNDPSAGELKHLGFGPLESFLNRSFWSSYDFRVLVAPLDTT